MVIYALYSKEWTAGKYKLRDVFPDEESARKAANLDLVSIEIQGVVVDRCNISEYGLCNQKEVYTQIKKPRNDKISSN